MRLNELLNENAWTILNNKAKRKFGEFGIMTCSEDEIAELINKDEADKLAKKMFGEFGFANLDEDQAKELINKNPKLVKTIKEKI